MRPWSPVNGLMAADFCIPEAIGLLFGGEQFDILAQSRST
jgi:hypothetical protein